MQTVKTSNVVSRQPVVLGGAGEMAQEGCLLQKYEKEWVWMLSNHAKSQMEWPVLATAVLGIQ